METSLAEKYQLQYMLLVKEFIAEVEKGAEWPELKPMIHQMRNLDQCLDCMDISFTTPKLVA